MNKESLIKLEDISNCCEVNIDDLTDLFEVKIIDYRIRDLNNGKQILNNEHEDRAIETIQRYFSANKSYSENWFE